MAFPKPLRLQLGLSLAEFADLLNTNLGQLSMAESGLRSLPPASLEIANTLEKALGTAKAKAADNKWSKKAMTRLNKEIRSGQVKLEGLQLQEEKLAEKLAAANCMLALSKTFTAGAAATHSEEVNLHMALLQRKADNKIAAYEAKQIQLQLAIAGTQAILLKAKELAFY